MASNAVAITGMGVISPLGNHLKTTWEAALAGRSGVGPIRHFDAKDFAVQIAAEAPEMAEEDMLSAREQRRVDRHILLATGAARQAWRDSGFDAQPPDPERVGICVGSGIGGIGFVEGGTLRLEEKGPRWTSPFLLPGSLINMPAGIISIDLNIQGPSLAVATACTTGVHSIGLAVRMLERGEADVMVAGGTEASITPLSIAAFTQSKALCDNSNASPQKASRPWDRDRKGFVMGEGAAVLILERLEAAKKRKNANIYAVINGFGMSSDAHHMTAPEPNGRGAELCMQAALKDAGIQASDVDYINAHATSTIIGDRAEAAAIRRVFGPNKVAVNATKSLTGHLLGAAGALESALTAMSIKDRQIHPTLNVDNEEDGMDLDIVRTVRSLDIRHAVCNSFGFGGTNASLVFSAVD